MFRSNVFYVLLDSVIGGLTVRYKAAHEINELFSFLWQYRDLSDDFLEFKVMTFIQKYGDDVSEDLLRELKDLNEANFGCLQLIF